MNKKSHCTKPEIWGGMECTINRVGDVYRDQLEETGHYERQDDLNKLCTLGFTKFRYPILWERHFPKEEKMQEWAWTTNQLNILRQRNITPIAGLIHHGSGPLHTDLLDMDFPVKLAAYAKQVAETFPWINYYTPVNEPLTTARFSGLYGFWYPHVKTDAGFVRMLINQLKGVVLSMQAIRKINPEATLVQTEDLSKTYSTPALAYQADFENQRRWLTYDLLTASVNEEHAAWKYFTANGIDEDELFFFLENPCPPGIAGFNYYVTSERFLDERIEHYPVHTHGHNHVQAYADTEAARSGHMKGAANLLAEAWWRYKIPLALTECQLACTREQQMKWFYQHFKIAENLCQQHIPVTGITAWGLLGAVDWNSLICLNNGQYESGAFEINKQKLRPTALATMIRTLSKRKDYHHPALDGKGWWQTGGSMAFESSTPLRAGSGKRLVIIDNDSRTGRILAGLCNQRNLLYRIISSGDAARADHHRLANAVDNYSPWAIVNLCEPLVRSNTELPGIFLEKEQRDHRSVIVHPSRIIQLLQLSADQSTAAEHCNPPDIELLFHRLNADNLPNYFSEHLTEKVSVGEAIDIKINDDQMTELINKALDLLIDNFEGIWHFKQETKDYQLISQKNTHLPNPDKHAQNSRQRVLKKIVVPPLPVH